MSTLRLAVANIRRGSGRAGARTEPQPRRIGNGWYPAAFPGGRARRRLRPSPEAAAAIDLLIGQPIRKRGCPGLILDHLHPICDAEYLHFNLWL